MRGLLRVIGALLCMATGASPAAFAQDYNPNTGASTAPATGTLVVPGRPTAYPSAQPTESVTLAFTGGANISVSTAASYTAFPAQTCKQLTIANNTGVTVQVQQGGAGAAQPVFPGTYYVFYGLTDASALAVERADGTATAVTVNARCEY